MAGSAMLSQGPPLNGTISDQNSDGGQTSMVAQIIQALEIVYDPRSSNDIRQQASVYLDNVKSADEAPYQGFALASVKSQPAVARYYGLSMLEHAVQHRWTEYDVEQSTMLRSWVVQLARHVGDEDPLYLRNKIARVWVELAKRDWALGWMDMDELLVTLWEESATKKELVLVVLETLSDDIFAHEDTVASLPGTELNKACVEIITPASVLSESFPTRETNIDVRYGSEGWLSRIGTLLHWCAHNSQDSVISEGCMIKALSTLRAFYVWAVPKALVATQSVHHVCSLLAVSSLPTKLAAIDALGTLFSRSRFHDDEFRDLVSPMYTVDCVSLFSKLYESSVVDPTDIDDDKYMLSKKLSELMYSIAKLLEQQPSAMPENSDIPGFLGLLLTMLKSQSLHVSIPVLHVWSKLLAFDTIATSSPVIALVGVLLEACGQRLIRFESLPENSSNPSIVFLYEDIDTLPERHAFLGNYKRFCIQVVELIVQRQPVEALHHIIGQADQVLNHLYDGELAFQARAYTKTSTLLLRLDAQLALIEAALKGYNNFLQELRHDQTVSVQQLQDHEIMTSNIRTWCNGLLERRFEDPLVKERIIQFAVNVATGLMKHDPEFAYTVFIHTLKITCAEEPDAPAYNEAVKELQGFCVHHLQSLAMQFPDHLITIYDEIKQRINEICASPTLDERRRIKYSAVLFIITHRASCLNSKQRTERLEPVFDTLTSRWQNKPLSEALASFDGFCDLMGLRNIQRYISIRNVDQIQDWSSYPLDTEGKTLQLRTQAALEGMPFNITKTLLGVSVEKLDPETTPYETACDIWQHRIPAILPNLIQFISHAHAFHNAANWSELPPEKHHIVGRVLRDRFWQVGISVGSRNDFYANLGDTKQTLEGLASSVRCTVRTVRDSGYRILFFMSLLGKNFYGYEELPVPLARALFADACSLSIHQLTTLVEMCKPIIENCPVDLRGHFLPPVVIGLFTQMDRKIVSEWDRIEERKQNASPEDDLTEEMKNESLLRQITSTSVIIVVGLLDPQSHSPAEASKSGSDNPPKITKAMTDNSMRAFVIRTPEILKPIILFCTHALRIHDTRSCSLIARVLSSLVPEFCGSSAVDADVREFISTEILKACITSVHDPYFVELQKDLAQLIASVVSTYSARTETPRQILQSLPDITAEKVDLTLKQMFKAKHNHRQQRALILDLLQGLRGVSISEQGRIARPDPKKVRSAMQERYMTVDVLGDGKKEPTPELGGIAEMFG